MINGETSISNLSSKNRALLHRVCADIGLEHYSTGNYNNRVFVIKDSQHTYFTQTLNDNYWENYLNNVSESNQINLNNNHLVYPNNTQDEEVEDEVEEEEVEEVKDKLDDVEYEEDDVEYEEDDEEEDDEEEDAEEEEKNTDTYSSDSESSNSGSTDSISNSEYTSLYLINKINYQGKMLKYIYILSLSNLLLNTYLMFSN